MVEHIDSEVAYVLVADIVEYSLLSMEAQAAIADRFKAIVRTACESEKGSNQPPLALDRGDGVVLVFFGGHSWAISCAATIACELHAAGINARTGLHCGPVARVGDVNGEPTVSGPGINLSERVMSCADPGQILLSGAAADMASSHEYWGQFLEDLGEHEVKHGVKLRLVNLVTGESGKRGMPERLQRAAILRDRRLNNFTEPDRPFIGRMTERENLRQRIESESDRLVTLTGPGGIGKTRLAIQVANELAPGFVDGVWIVDCSVVTGREDLVAHIAAVLESEPGDDPMGSLRVTLADKQMLLVIDSFERLVAHARVLEDLLKHARELQIIVTSRTLLGLPRENEFVLGPLSLQKGHGLNPDAVTLFVDAAKSVLHDFRFTRQNHDVVESIVKAVEGVPLAIVLAAGRLRHMSLAELSDQLGTRQLEILKRRPVGEDRHANLTRVVDDSFGLLRDDLKELLVSLSVFRGGFRVADAQAVLTEGTAVLDGISELRDNSLLSAQVVDDQMRYRFLDVIAEYIEGLADQKQLEPLRGRHAKYYVGLAIELRALYEGGRWKEANAGLGVELGNYRRAIEYAVDTEDEALTKPLASSLGRLLMEAGYRADFDKLVTAVRRIAETEQDLPQLIEMSGLLGGVYLRDRNFEAAETQWVARARYCAIADKTEQQADTWLDLADMALTHGDPSKADQYLELYAELEPRLHQGLVLASGYIARAKAEARKGHSETAKKLAARAQTLAVNLPHRMHSFYIWWSLADVLNMLGEPYGAARVCRSGIRETILGRHFSYAGILLTKLAVSLEMQGSVELSGEAIIIAAAIPKSVSQTLREQVKAQHEGFVRRHGMAPLKAASQQMLGLTWQVAALNLVDRLGTNGELC